MWDGGHIAVDRTSKAPKSLHLCRRAGHQLPLVGQIWSDSPLDIESFEFERSSASSRQLHKSITLNYVDYHTIQPWSSTSCHPVSLTESLALLGVSSSCFRRRRRRRSAMMKFGLSFVCVVLDIGVVCFEPSCLIYPREILLSPMSFLACFIMESCLWI